MKPLTAPVVETAVVDVIDKPVPGVAVFTEFEATEVREASPEQPEESHSAPPETEQP
jgi:hypothetical protein